MLHIMFLNFAESFIMACWLHFRNKKWEPPSWFLRYKQLKPKYGVFFQSFLVATLTFYITKMTEYFLAITGVWYGTITLLSSDKVLWCQSSYWERFFQVLKLVWATLTLTIQATIIAMISLMSPVVMNVPTRPQLLKGWIMLSTE